VPQPDDLARLSRLAALLRLAEYLDRGRNGAVASLKLTAKGRKSMHLVVRSRPQAKTKVEVWEAQRNTDLFEEAYDCKLEIEAR
jgi:exopolyphosphatase/guanosine-5'-triphosphate,3'-diphosphate pyrophosphatase